MSPTMRFGPDDEAAFNERAAQLTAQFDAWLRRQGVPEGDLSAVVSDLDLLLHWRWGYGGGDLGRWREDDLDEFLLGWCPRKVTAPPDLAQPMPRHVGQAMLFLADAGLLDPGSAAAATLDRHARSLEPQFSREMASPQNYGMAKSMLAGLGDLDDLDLDDPHALDRLMAQFNALPDDERAEILDAPIERMMRDAFPDRVVVPPTADELRAAARSSRILAVFDVLTDYFEAPGKLLTKTKAIKIADAVALAELLGTGEKAVDEIGDRSFRKSSSRDFGQVDFWVSYAKAAGALRHHRGRMVGVQAWQRRRRSDPAAEATKAAGLLLTSGPIAVHTGYYTEIAEILDMSVIPMLAALSGEGEILIDELVDRSQQVLEHQQIHELYPGELPRALAQQLDVLDDCGLVVRTPKPAPEQSASEQSGSEGTGSSLLAPPDLSGTVAATPLGVQAVIDVSSLLGLPVTAPPPAQEQTVAGLVELLASVPESGIWWDLTARWLDEQPDYPQAVRALLDAIGEESLAVLIGMLGEMPDAEAERMTPLLWELARAVGSPDDEVGLAAVGFLAERDPAVVELDQSIAFCAAVVALGASCDAGAGEGAIAAVTQLPDDEAREFLTGVGTVRSPRAVSLLDTVGRRHPDKRLAKVARKELFRLRSRLATE